MIVHSNSKCYVERCFIPYDNRGNGKFEFFIDRNDGKNLRVVNSRDKAIDLACKYKNGEKI